MLRQFFHQFIEQRIKMIKTLTPRANPTISNCNTRTLAIYSNTNNLVRFCNKNYIFTSTYLKITIPYFNAGVLVVN
jgi:hypothetical protein